jgi:hypothetical protein
VGTWKSRTASQFQPLDAVISTALFIDLVLEQVINAHARSARSCWSRLSSVLPARP